MDLETVSVEVWRPVELATLKANLRRLSAAEDALLATYISAATSHVEQRTKLSVLGRTLRLSLPALPTTLELPAPPLRYAVDADPFTAITSLRYRASGVMTTLAADTYRVQKDAQVWTLVRGDTALPTADTHPRAFEVTFAVGYRDLAHMQAQAPDLIDAIVLLASHRDSNREATINEPRVMQISRKVELAFDDLIRPYIVRTRYTPQWV
jgi:uncharacterized phiE125 gp8 family phage protein